MTRPRYLLATIVAAVSALGALPVATVEAASFTVTLSLPAGQFGLGVDHVTTNGGTLPSGYEQIFEAPVSVCKNNPTIASTDGRLTIAPVNSTYSTISRARIEIYQKDLRICSSAQRTVSGAVVTVTGTANIGLVPMPTAGQPATGRFQGRILSSTPITTDRVRFSMFQQKGQHKSSAGVPIDAFTAGKISTTTYSTNPLWDGQYITFITDNTTGRKVTGIVNVKGDTTLDIDLDAPCFGINECQLNGSTPTPAGKYHPITPTRIVNTSTGVGISGAVKPGDGRLGDPNPVNRMAARKNHEFVVTGTAGIPASGVSAILANVTVIGTTASSAVRMFPKPSRTMWANDQSSFPSANTQAPVAYVRAGELRSTTQLLKLGVGGRVRVDNVGSASVHLRVDVLGWFDSSQPGQGGERVVAVAPTRMMDSRSGVATRIGTFGTGETRTVTVRDGSVVPSSAHAVFGTLSSISSSARATDIVWEANTSRPAVLSHVEAVDSGRANLVGATVDSSGNWSVFHSTGTSHLMLDVSGYSTAAAGAGGSSRAIAPVRVAATAAQGAGATRSMVIGGAGSGAVPAGAKAAWVLVTTASSSTSGVATLWASGLARPAATQVRWSAGVTNATLVLVPVGADGRIALWSSKAVTTTVDALGWVN